MAEALRDFMERGLVNLIGGCCGTTPEHITAMKRVPPNLMSHGQSFAQHLLGGGGGNPPSPQTRIS